MKIRVGTRGSPLALAQTEIVLRRLRGLNPGHVFTVEVVHSSADKSPNAPLASMPRGVFAKELEAALASNKIDIAVHSFKDLRHAMFRYCFFLMDGSCYFEVVVFKNALRWALWEVLVVLI